jgi:hypothetical protein
MDRSGEAQDANAALVRVLMEEVLHAGRMLLLPQLIAPDYVCHLPIGDHYGPEGVRIDFAGYREAIPGLAVTLHDLFATGDRVARRFTLHDGSPGTTCPLTLHGIAIDRLARGRLIESWVQIDALPQTTP